MCLFLPRRYTDLQVHRLRAGQGLPCHPATELRMRKRLFSLGPRWKRFWMHRGIRPHYRGTLPSRRLPACLRLDSYNEMYIESEWIWRQPKGLAQASFQSVKATACVNKVAPSTFLKNHSSLHTVTFENHCERTNTRRHALPGFDRMWVYRVSQVCKRGPSLNALILQLPRFQYNLNNSAYF